MRSLSCSRNKAHAARERKPYAGLAACMRKAAALRLMAAATAIAKIEIHIVRALRWA